MKPTCVLSSSFSFLEQLDVITDELRKDRLTIVEVSAGAPAGSAKLIGFT